MPSAMWRIARFLGLVCVLAGVPGGYGGAAPAAARPSFVIVLADDMSSGQMVAMRRTRTLIGDAGMTFERAYVEAPVCAPARATLLTGKLAHNHGVLSTAGTRPRMMAVDHDTIATRLSAAGYRTAYFGKYNNGYGCAYVPAGWQLWRGFCKLNSVGATTLIDGVETRLPGHSDDWMRDNAAAYIRGLPAGAPFLVVLSSVQPHTPHDPHPRHRGMFSGAQVPRTPAFNEADVRDLPTFLQKPLLTPTQVLEMDRSWANSLDELQTIDEMVEGVYGALRDSGRLSQTYLMFLSDHGMHFGEHRFSEGKWRAFETDIRIPLLIRGPGVPARARQNAMVGIVDVPTTILQLAGVATTGMDGISFSDALRGGRSQRTAMPIAFWTEQYRLHWKGVRGARYTYAEYSASTRLLYDNIADPYQINNLARDPSKAAVVNELRAWTARLFTCRGPEACRG